MPSLKVVKNSVVENTYQHFFTQLVEYDDPSLNKSLIISFLKCCAAVVLFTLFVYFTTIQVWIFLVFNFYDFYENFNVYLVRVIIYMIVQWFAYSLLTFLIFNHVAKNSFKKILLISFVIFIVINGSIGIWLGIQYHNNKIEYFKSFCDMHKIVYSFDCNIWFSFYRLYIFIFYSTISFLILVIVNHLWICNIHCLRIQLQSIPRDSNYNRNRNRNINDNDKNINQSNFEMRLLDTQNDRDHNMNTVDHDDKYDHYDNLENVYSSNKVLCTYITFGLIWMLFFWFMYVVGDLAVNDFKNYFLCVLCSTWISRKVLKYIARRIDVINTINTNTHDTIEDDKNVNISLELLMEIGVNLEYYSCIVLL